MKKVFFIVVLGAIILSSCCSVKETISSRITSRDTTFYLPAIAETLTVADAEFNIWADNTINALWTEIDSLQNVIYNLSGVDVPANKRTKPRLPRGEWKVDFITKRGDSIWVTFVLKNGDGTFTYREVPGVVKVRVNDTQTDTTKEKELAWYEKIWRDFKDFILVGLIFVMGIGLLWQRFKA